MAIVSVIEYHGTPDVLAWKYPETNLGTWTQLIVHASQEAVLFRNGRAFDVFPGGRYTLETPNIPLLNGILKLPYGGRSPFAAEVWFVSKRSTLDIKWGTTSPIQLQDPKYGVFVPVRAFGQFGVQIQDAKKFLVKLVGTVPILRREELIKYFRGLYLTKARDAIASFVIHKRISIVEINACLDALSEHLKGQLEPVLELYGIQLLNFYVNEVNVPEGDPAVAQLKQALAKRAEMDIIGYDYRLERSFDAMEGAAQNTGGLGDFLGAGAGLGLGAQIGSAMGERLGALFRESASGSLDSTPAQRYGEERLQQDTKRAPEESERSCRGCGAVLRREMRFCPQCGIPALKRCPACGALRPIPDARFCTACGRPMEPICPACGAPSAADSQFCSACGRRLSGLEEP